MSGSTSPPSESEGGSGAVARNTGLLAIARIVDRAGGFVLAVLIATRLGASGLGTFTAATAIYGVMTIAGAAGITNFLVREISRDRTKTASYIVHLSVVGAAVSIVLIAGLEVIVRHLGYAPSLRTSASIIALATLPTVLNAIQEAAFVAHGRVEFETLCTLGQTIAYVAIGTVLVARGYGVPALMAAFVALEYAVTLTYFVLITLYIAPLRPAFRLAEARRLVGEMKAFTLSSALAVFFSRPEVLLLSIMATPRQLGYYGAAVRVADLPVFIPQVFMMNVFTVLSRTFEAAERRFSEVLGKAVRYMLVFALPMSVLIIVSAPQIVRLLFGPQFGPSVAVLRILAVGVVFTSLYEVFWRSLAARHRQGTVVWIQAVMIGIRLGGAALLIAPLAAVGAAAASTLSYFVHVSLLIAATARSGASARVVQPALRLIPGCVSAGALAWALTHWVPVWIVLPAGALAYGAVVLALRGLASDDRESLGRLGRRLGTVWSARARLRARIQTPAGR